MANRTFYPPYSYGSSRVYAEFSYLSNNATTPLVSTVDGADIVASFNRTGVGIIVVTLKDPFNKVITANVDVDDTANDGAYATIGNITSEGTATPISFTIRTRSAAGALADMAVSRKVSVQLAFRNGSWGTK